MDADVLRDTIIERPWTAMAAACAAGCISALGRRRGSLWAPLADMIAASMLALARLLAVRQMDPSVTRRPDR